MIKKYYGFGLVLLAVFASLLNLAKSENNNNYDYRSAVGRIPAFMLSDTLPSDFPKFTVDSIDNPSEGYVFLTNNSQSLGTYAMIIDKTGKPFKYKRTNLPTFDFKVQPNGVISYQEPLRRSIGGDGWAPSIVKLLDTNLVIFDSVQCKSGYTADFHDFLYASNGHYFLMSYDAQPMDMSKYTPDGNPNAIAIGAVVQELDADKNLVFEWRSWEDIPISDTYNPLNTPVVDYVHINALDFDVDGNLMVSSRHLNETTKINRMTGEIMWRFGGKKNQFSFVNENEQNAPDYFSEQHDIRRLINGNVTLFDNGNRHVPEYSRAVEYTLDEFNKTATMVWEYRHEPDIASRNQGSAQRLDDGSTLIGWGGAGFQGLPSISEINSDKKITFELSLPKGVTFGQTTYRAYKYKWPLGVKEGDKSFQISDKNTDLDFSEQGVKVHFNNSSAAEPKSMSITRYNWAPTNARFEIFAPWVPKYRLEITGNSNENLDLTVKFDLKKFQWIKFPEKFTVFWRQSVGSGTFKALETTFNSADNALECKVKNFGEFVFGLVQSEPMPNKPTLLKPVNSFTANYLKPVDFLWTVKGIILKSHIIIANDKDFNDIIVDDSTVKSNKFSYKFDNNADCFWKVRCGNSTSWSPWSETFRFRTSVPMIQVTSPVAGNVLVKDSAKYTIRWFANIDDMMKIELYRNGEYYITLNDTVRLNTGGLWWKIQSFVPSENKYQIRISSLADTTVFGISQEFFAIRDSLVGVENWNDYVNNDINIISNYPNPSNNFTEFVIESGRNEYCYAGVYDFLGQQISEFPISLNLGQNKVKYETAGLVPGMYIFEIKSKGMISRLKFNVIR